jgi:hypothetical protein
MARLTKADKSALAWAVYQSLLHLPGFGMAQLKNEGKPYANWPDEAQRAAEDALRKMGAHWEQR